MIRSRTRSSSSNRTAERAARGHRHCASPAPRARSTCRSSSPGSRAANTIPTASASRRRATKASVSAEARSSHCASSTTHNSGRSSATSESKLNTPKPTRNRSGTAPVLEPEHDLQRLTLRCREAVRADRASARTADGGWRRPAPSPTPPLQPAYCQIRRRLDQVLEQRRLPDPGLPRRTSDRLSPRRGTEQPVQQRALIDPPAQSRPPSRSGSRAVHQRDGSYPTSPHKFDLKGQEP